MKAVVKSFDLKFSVLAPCIIASLITLSFYRSSMQIMHGEGPPITMANIQLTDTQSQHLTGKGPGGCGITIGIVAGIAGLALGGVTVGLGTALAFSAGLHASAMLCAA